MRGNSDRNTFESNVIAGGTNAWNDGINISSKTHAVEVRAPVPKNQVASVAVEGTEGGIAGGEVFLVGVV